MHKQGWQTKQDPLAIQQKKAKNLHKYVKSNEKGHTFSKESSNFQDRPSEWKVRVTSPTWSNKRVELKMGGSPLEEAGAPGRDSSSPARESFPSLSIDNGRVKETRW